MTYDPYSPFWNKFSASAPMGASMIEMLAPLLQSMGMDVTPWLNILRYNRADRPFFEMDNSQFMQARNQFRAWTAGDPATTNLQSVGRAFAGYFLDDKGTAESALRRGISAYAFGTGGLSMGDFMPGWDTMSMGRYNDQFTRYMADIYNFDLPDSISKGQRSWIAGEMTRANPSILQNYGMMRQIGNELGRDYVMQKGEDWQAYSRRIRERIADEREAGLGDTGPVSNLKDALIKLADQMSRTQQKIEDFGEAANNWGRVLKTDAQAAMQKVSTMLGGSVYSIFSGDEQALAEMPFRQQHTGAVTGRGSAHMMAVTEQTRQYLKATGGPIETAMNVANEAMLQSTGGSRYWMTQEGLDKMYLQYNADLWNTDAGNVARGAAQFYTEFRMRNLRPGQVFNEADTVKEIDAILRSTGGDVSVQNINRALSRATGMNVNLGIGDYQMLGNMTYANDYMAHSNAFPELSRQQGQRELVNQIFAAQGSNMTYDSLYRMNDRILGPGMDVMELIQMNGHDLSEMGLNRQQMNFVQNVNRMMQMGTMNLQTNHPEVMGNMAGRSVMEIARFTSRTSRERETALRRQRDLRTQLSGMVNGSDMFRSMSNYIRRNPDASIGELLAAGGTADLDGQALDTIAALRVSGEDRRELARTFSKLGNSTNSSSDRAYYKHLIDEFNNELKNGQNLYQASKKLTDLGISYDVETDSLSVGQLDWKTFRAGQNQWMKENREKAKRQETVLKMSAKDGNIGNMSFFDKKEAAERLAVVETIKNHLASGGKDDEAYNYKYFLEAAEKGDKRAFEDLYDTAREAAQKSKGFHERLEKTEEEMGISHDKSDTGAVIANILHEIGSKFMQTFTEGSAIKVMEVNAQ